MGYPAALDGTTDERPSVRAVIGHTIDTARLVIRRRTLRRLVAESMGYDGMFDTVKDYLQPVLQAAAVALAATYVVTADWSDTRRTALLVGPIYFVLYLLAGLASRNAHRVPTMAGGEERAARVMWAVAVVIFAALAVGGWLDALPVVIVGFVLLHVAHNLWRPVLISRFDRHGPEKQGASLLSVESQARRACTMVAAPILGWAVDSARSGGQWWPIGVAGLVVSTLFLVTSFRRRPLASPSETT
jgi:hypothetical protein